MHTPAPNPLTVWQVATEHGISEEQAATAVTWASHMTVHAWEAYADRFGLVANDGDAMEAWFRSLGPEASSAVIDEAVTAVIGAESVLAKIYQQRDAERARRRPRRPTRVNRPRVRIR